MSVELIEAEREFPACVVEFDDLGYALARRGLIATYALAHAVPILTGDVDFVAMKSGGLDLMLGEA